MLKTSEKNSPNSRKKSISKLLAAWVTDLRLRFRNDIFFSTRIKIVGFVTLLALLTTLCYIALLAYIKQITLLGVINALTVALASGGVVTPEAFFESNVTAENAMFFVMGIIILLSVLAGLLVSRLALAPVARALQLQKKFILSVAHELRTPLAVLKTTNEVALFENNIPESVRTLLFENIEDINHMSEILNNLLLFNRTDANGVISYEEVDLQALLLKIQMELAPLAQSKNILFTFSPDTIPTVLGNLVALEQAFYNLIKNAILYTQRGGEVSVRCTKATERMITIAISDTGIGIPKIDLPHIFEPFFRTDAAEKKVRGTGLGLTLVFEIIKLHQGTIEVESVINKGTSFLISIPRYASRLSDTSLHSDTTVRFDFGREENEQVR